jgi:hypothetical protein
MRNMLLVAGLGVAATLAAACSGGGGVDTLLNGAGVQTEFADSGSGGGGNPTPIPPTPSPTTDPTTGIDSGTVGPPHDAGKPPPPPAGAGIPCNVAAVLAAKCVSCHSDPPINGSLSGLVTLADLMATSKEDATKNEAQLSLQRMQGTPSPMPPASLANPATAADIAAFQSWINGGYTGSCADAGSPPPAGVDPFAGAPAFASQVGPDSHNAGQNCMGGCHNHGFTFAGTLVDAAGNGVAGAEVRLLDTSGVAVSVYTGPNGNFHSSATFTAPAHVGARDATNKALMVTALAASNGGCNGCHATGGTVAPIHLP